VSLASATVIRSRLNENKNAPCSGYDVQGGNDYSEVKLREELITQSLTGIKLFMRIKSPHFTALVSARTKIFFVFSSIFPEMTLQERIYISIFWCFVFCRSPANGGIDERFCENVSRNCLAREKSPAATKPAKQVITQTSGSHAEETEERRTGRERSPERFYEDLTGNTPRGTGNPVAVGRDVDSGKKVSRFEHGKHHGGLFPITVLKKFQPCR